jgi:hypothetical protein
MATGKVRGNATPSVVWVNHTGRLGREEILYLVRVIEQAYEEMVQPVQIALEKADRGEYDS